MRGWPATVSITATIANERMASGHDMTIMDTPTKMTVNPAESVCGMLWVMT